MDCFAALAMTAKRTFAASPRNAPEALAQLIPRATETVVASEAKQSIFHHSKKEWIASLRNDGAGDGLLRGVYHRARIRATRWLHPSTGYGSIQSITKQVSLFGLCQGIPRISQDRFCGPVASAASPSA